MTDQYHSDLFVLWQDDHTRGQQTTFEEIKETIQGKLRRSLIYGHYSHYLQLFSMIKHSQPHPAIQLSSHRPNWFKQVIMKSLQILSCPSLRKSACPSMFMWVYSTIWLPCEFWCSRTLHVSVSGFFFFFGSLLMSSRSIHQGDQQGSQMDSNFPRYIPGVLVLVSCSFAHTTGICQFPQGSPGKVFIPSQFYIGKW